MTPSRAKMIARSKRTLKIRIRAIWSSSLIRGWRWMLISLSSQKRPRSQNLFCSILIMHTPQMRPLQSIYRSKLQLPMSLQSPERHSQSLFCKIRSVSRETRLRRSRREWRLSLWSILSRFKGKWCILTAFLTSPPRQRMTTRTSRQR